MRLLLLRHREPRCFFSPWVIPVLCSEPRNAGRRRRISQDSVVNGNSLIQFLCVWCQSWCFPSVSCVSLMMFSRNVCGTDFGQVLNCESRYLWYLPKLVVCVCVCVRMFLFVLWFIHLHLCVSCKWQCHLRQWEFYLSGSGLNKQCGHTLSRYLRGVTIVKTSLKSPRKHPQYPATKASSQCPC